MKSCGRSYSVDVASSGGVLFGVGFAAYSVRANVETLLGVVGVGMPLLLGSESIFKGQTELVLVIFSHAHTSPSCTEFGTIDVVRVFANLFVVLGGYTQYEELFVSCHALRCWLCREHKVSWDVKQLHLSPTHQTKVSKQL